MLKGPYIPSYPCGYVIANKSCTIGFDNFIAIIRVLKVYEQCLLKFGRISSRHNYKFYFIKCEFLQFW